MFSKIGRWFAYRSDAEVSGRTREEMHLKRASHHLWAASVRFAWFMVILAIGTVAALLIGIEVSLWVLLVLAAGLLLGALAESFIHHLRKIRFHQHLASPPTQPAE